MNNKKKWNYNLKSEKNEKRYFKKWTKIIQILAIIM